MRLAKIRPDETLQGDFVIIYCGVSVYETRGLSLSMSMDVCRGFRSPNEKDGGWVIGLFIK